MNLQNLYVTFKGLKLKPSQTTRLLSCPICHGGLNKDKYTFSITYLEEPQWSGWLYHCFRAKCQAQGAISSAVESIATNDIHSPADPRDLNMYPTPMNYPRHTTAVPDHVISAAQKIYPALIPSCLTLNRVKIAWDEKDLIPADRDPLYFPLKSTQFSQDNAGEHIRSLWPGEKKRTMWYNKSSLHKPIAVFAPSAGTLFNNYNSNSAFVLSTTEIPYVLVEDALSAIILSQFIKVRCMLGFGISKEGISQLKYDKGLIFWPDPDTWEVPPGSNEAPPASKLVSRLSDQLNVVARVLDQDPKYMTKEEIITCLVADVARLNLKIPLKELLKTEIYNKYVAGGDG